MFKIKINNIDVLPYIIIFVVSVCFILFQMSVRNVIKLKYEWELGCFTFIIFALGTINYIKKISNPKDVNLSDLISTEDIRVSSYEYKGFVNTETDMSFVKFYFSSDETYMYYRNFFPIKIYQGPFSIGKKSSSFTLKEFEKLNTTEVRIHIESKNKVVSYTLCMRNISKKDFDLLEDHFVDNKEVIL